MELTSVNETLGISPYQAVFGRAAIGPLQLSCDDWIGKRPLSLDIAKAPCEYLTDLERKLQTASEYAMQHADREQTRYTHAYNLRSRDKSFQVGERVNYLMPSSTHKLTRTWQGPCVVVKKKLTVFMSLHLTVNNNGVTQIICENIMTV
jgi:hypothetical protein